VLDRGFFPVLNGGGSTLAVVHASSVADGAVRAASIDAAGGNCYNLANDFPVTVAEFARLAGVGLGRRVRLVSFPTSLARVAFAIVRGALRATGSGAIAAQSTGTLDFLSRDNPFTSERARRELGWSPATKPDVGVPDAFRWWKEHGTR
jgi:nucleoside-diphosphate-sugar epimerase